MYICIYMYIYIYTQICFRNIVGPTRNLSIMFRTRPPCIMLRRSTWCLSLQLICVHLPQLLSQGEIYTCYCTADTWACPSHQRSLLHNCMLSVNKCWFLALQFVRASSRTFARFESAWRSLAKSSLINIHIYEHVYISLHMHIYIYTHSQGGWVGDSDPSPRTASPRLIEMHNPLRCQVPCDTPPTTPPQSLGRKHPIAQRGDLAVVGIAASSAPKQFYSWPRISWHVSWNLGGRLFVRADSARSDLESN